MGQRLADENGVIDFIDENGVQCFLDEDGNFTCSQSPPSSPTGVLGYAESEW